MDSATIGLVASLATTLIIAVTAFAALRQIRHNRTANELQIYLRFVDEVSTPQMMDSIRWTHDFAKRLKDPEYRITFARDAEGEDHRRFSGIVRFFERYASLVIVSGISEHLLFFEYAGLISLVWENIYEAFPLARSTGMGRYGGRAFEHLAVRAQHYAKNEMLREYARLERDPRIVALESANPITGEDD
ncbi:MAG TPA: hypothetical protein VNF68_02545 [Candidatus Baltobacteraceae bacterium]|nr:hypothetical protein [Candidatus Baltobacteraceae bacterium]